ncbi:MAG TPA: serine hydrolase [Gemmatimonadales bacterium]|nr:serine hydrolase [Gemmatimonadales bacterium]
MRLVPVLAFALFTAAAPQHLCAQAPARPLLPPNFDATVQRALTDLHTPGIAIAVVKDGRIVFAKGYGIRKLGSPERVDTSSVFQVASNTKATTAAILAQLVDEGKLKWDDRVIDRLPWFAMSDPYVTREMRVQDLLTHVSGFSLGMGDLLWFYSDFTRREIAERVRYLPIANSFRSAYAYDNVLYAVATMLIEEVEHKSWDEVIRDRIIRPVGMTSASTTVRGWDPRGNWAWPHAVVDGRLQIVDQDTVDNLAGGAALNASVADMARWVRVQLDSGRVDASRRLWSQDQSRLMWLGRISQANGRGNVNDVSAGFAEYALGWGTYDWMGNKVVTHTGGLSGQITRVWMLPAKKLGFVILTNGESPAMGALTNVLRDWLTDRPGPVIDYVGRAAAPGAEFDYAAFDRGLDSARIRNTTPSLPLAGYAATWVDPWYGEVTTAMENGKLMVRFSRNPGFTGELTHWHNNVFRVRFLLRQVPDAWMWFTLDREGKAAEARMEAVYPNTDFSFDWQDLRLARK